jgi:hypothetical protein
MEENTANKTITLDRINSIILFALKKTFPDNINKQKVYKYPGRITMSCPYCGDSNDARKKRGNLYLDTLTYKCYNGGCGVFKNLNQYTRDFEIQNMLSTDEIAEIAEISRSSVARKKIRNSIDFFFTENYKDVLIPREVFKERLELEEVKGTFAEKWILNRNHSPDAKFLWDPRRKNLYLLNLTGDDSFILGIQMRPIVKKSSSKYFTYKLSGIYKNLFGEKNPDIISKAEEVDPISSVFGFSTVDLDAMITTFEGPMDAWLCPNSIALCSINNQFPFDVSNKRWFLDGDKAGRTKSRELLDKGEQVFLWGKFLKENSFPDRDKWDLNDVVNYLRSTGKKIKRLDNYFSADKWDIIEI